MNARNSAFGARWSQVVDYTPIANLDKGVHEWWLTPPRAGIYRVIAPWAYRHLRFFGVATVCAGVIPAAAGVICLAYSAYGMAAFFLGMAALSLGGGSWYLAIDRSRHPSTSGC
jgi:hypothetical protein